MPEHLRARRQPRDLRCLLFLAASLLICECALEYRGPRAVGPQAGELDEIVRF